MPKKIPDYIREKAIQMRVERQMSIDEIAERLALPRTTIYYWVKDIPLGRERRQSLRQRVRAQENVRRWQLKRDAAYAEGAAMFPELEPERGFREFVCMYLAEGYKRSRSTVSVANSDPTIVRLCTNWIRRFTQHDLRFSLQYHADQDLDALRAFWSEIVGCEPEDIRVQRKSNSNQLCKRTWRSEHGVLTVAAHDTYFRSRMQAWMDLLRAEWT